MAMGAVKPSLRTGLHRYTDHRPGPFRSWPAPIGPWRQNLCLSAVFCNPGGRFQSLKASWTGYSRLITWPTGAGSSYAVPAKLQRDLPASGALPAGMPAARFSFSLNRRDKVRLGIPCQSDTAPPPMRTLRTDSGKARVHDWQESENGPPTNRIRVENRVRAPW